MGNRKDFLSRGASEGEVRQLRRREQTGSPIGSEGLIVGAERKKGWTLRPGRPGPKRSGHSQMSLVPPEFATARALRRPLCFGAREAVSGKYHKNATLFAPFAAVQRRSSAGGYGFIVFLPKLSFANNQNPGPRKFTSYFSKGLRYLLNTVEFHSAFSRAVAPHLMDTTPICSSRRGWPSTTFT
jgi:hypothetical protein